MQVLTFATSFYSSVDYSMTSGAIWLVRKGVKLIFAATIAR